MSYSKYIKDTRLSTREFYIAKQISEDRYKIIYIKGSWSFSLGESISKFKVFNSFCGTYKSEEIKKSEAFLEMI